MRIHVVGCSPAWPNPGGAQSGYLVEEDGRRLLLDCGPGVLPRLRKLEPWPRLDAIVITHFHLDHWGDLVPWAFGGLFGAGREVQPPELWLPHGGRETLRGLDPVLYANAILELFEVHEYAEETPFVAAGFELVVEKAAGAAASFPDEAYTDAGATIGDPWDADGVVKVRKP